MEYQISFYDTSYGIRKILTGLVVDVYEDQIKFKYVKEKNIVDCKTCDNRNRCNKLNNNSQSSPMPSCNCILNPPDMSKYDDPKIYFIPISNIMDVSYIKGNNPAEPPKHKGGTKVMILGISATVVKAIIIKLEIFDDNCDEAVKYVDMEVGGIYDISYELHNTIYESRVKVVAIRECESDHRHHNKHSSIVRENVCMNDNVYYDHHNRHDKADFMKEPPVRKIEITVDTSETFDGNLEVIMLDTIRDCTLIQPPIHNDIIYEDPSFRHESDCECGCSNNE